MCLAEQKQKQNKTKRGEGRTCVAPKLLRMFCVVPLKLVFLLTLSVSGSYIKREKKRGKKEEKKGPKRALARKHDRHKG